jgi:hypothetical protein
MRRAGTKLDEATDMESLRALASRSSRPPARSAAVLTVLALSGWSSERWVSDPAGQTGTLDMPLSVERAGVTYRFLGTVRILRAADGSVAASVSSDLGSDSTHTVSLAPGDYKVEVADGYTCAVEPADPAFTGCTNVSADPDPFGVTAGATTHVALAFDFHLGEDTPVVLYGGEAVLELAPTVPQRCINGCAADELCVSFRNAPAACTPIGEPNRQVRPPNKHGNLLLVGYTPNTLPGQGSAGGNDGFFAKLAP